MSLLLAIALQVAPVAWRLDETVDPITDRRMAVARLAQDGAQIAIGCSAESTGNAGVAIGLGRYLSSDGTAGMAVRFDGGEPERMLVSYFGRHVEITRASDAARFAGMLGQSRRVVVQIGDSDGRLHNAIFDLPERGAELGAALAQCGPFGNIE